MSDSFDAGDAPQLPEAATASRREAEARGPLDEEIAALKAHAATEQRALSAPARQEDRGR